MAWETISETLQAIVDSELALTDVLKEFRDYVLKCLEVTKEHMLIKHWERYDPVDLKPMVWSLGSMQAGRWIDNTYKATG